MATANHPTNAEKEKNNGNFKKGKYFKRKEMKFQRGFDMMSGLLDTEEESFVPFGIQILIDDLAGCAALPHREDRIRITLAKKLSNTNTPPPKKNKIKKS
ncbi:MAG: hypothetical protein Pars93KO_27040 [Parasphingorhabdus sp.]